ncbi:MAG TPA: DUF6491 family protein [Caulobacteraceae bacterium]|nr:DUF6491 family protein [Caulobacteraceae bacterium]
MTKLLLAALAATVAASAAAGAQAGPRHAQNDTPCFFISQWEGWKAPDDHTLYLGVNYHEVYKVGLAGGSSILQDPEAHIVSITQGPDSVCNPLDLQLSIVEPYGIREPLIAKSLVKLTPEEVKAIPPKYRPY